MARKPVIAAVLSLMLAGGCRHAPPKALAHPTPTDVWRSGVEVEPPVLPAEPPDSIIEESVEGRLDRATLNPLLRQEINLHAENAPVAQILLTLAKQAGANITVDKGVTGETSVQFSKIPLIDAVENLIRPLGYSLSVDGAYLHVNRTALGTRLYHLDLPGASRKGDMKVTVSDRVIAASASIPGVGASSSAGGGDTGSSTSIESKNSVDVWKDVANGLKAIVLSEAAHPATEGEGGGALAGYVDKQGRALVVNPGAGTVQVRAEPAIQEAVRNYLRSLQKSLQRQVVIEARVLEITLNDEFQMGVNLSYALQAGRGIWNVAQSTVAAPAVGLLVDPNNPGLNVGGRNVAGDVQGLITALSKAGRVDVVSAPRIAVTNNQKAVVKVVKERIFFLAQVTPTFVSASGQLPGAKQFIPMVVNEGIVLDVTPQIGADGWVTMNVHPSYAEVTGVVKTPGGGADGALPEMSRREFATVVRVFNEQTVMIGGLMSQKTEVEEDGVPFLKDIWLLGHLFRSTHRVNRKAELVLLLTPHIVGAASHAQVTRDAIDRLREPTEPKPVPVAPEK